MKLELWEAEDGEGKFNVFETLAHQVDLGNIPEQLATLIQDIIIPYEMSYTHIFLTRRSRTSNFSEIRSW